MLLPFLKFIEVLCLLSSDIIKHTPVVGHTVVLCPADTGLPESYNVIRKEKENNTDVVNAVLQYNEVRWSFKI